MQWGANAPEAIDVGEETVEVPFMMERPEERESLGHR